MSEAPNAKGRPGRLVGALLNYGLGGYVPQIVSFVLAPVYTRFINPSEYGELELALSAQALLTAFMRFGLPGALARMSIDKDPTGTRNLVTTLGVAMMGISAVVAGLGLVVHSMGSRALWPELSMTYFALAVMGAFFQGPIELQRRLFQVREQSRRAAALAAAMGFATIGLSVLFVLIMRLGGVGVLLAATTVTIGFSCAAAWMNREDLRGRLEGATLRHALQYGGPLVPHHVAAWAQQFGGRWVLSGVASTAAVGQLAIAGRLASPLAVVTGAFSNAFTPIYFRWRRDLPDAEALVAARRVGRSVVTLGSIAVVGASTFGALVARYVLDARYAGAIEVIGVAAFALHLHLTYAFVVIEVFFSGRTKWIAFIFLVSSAVTIGSSLFLAVEFGALGAAWAQVAGGTVSVVLASIYSRTTFPWLLDARVILASMAICVASVLLGPAIQSCSWGYDLLTGVALFALMSALMLVLGGGSREIAEDLGAIGSRLRRRRGGA